MEKWEWEMMADFARVLEPFKGYGNDIFFPEVAHALVKVARKYAQELVKLSSGLVASMPLSGIKTNLPFCPLCVSPNFLAQGGQRI